MNIEPDRIAFTTNTPVQCGVEKQITSDDGTRVSQSIRLRAHDDLNGFSLVFHSPKHHTSSILKNCHLKISLRNLITEMYTYPFTSELTFLILVFERSHLLFQNFFLVLIDLIHLIFLLAFGQISDLLLQLIQTCIAS